MLDSVTIAKELGGAARIGILQIDGVQVHESPEKLKVMLNALADECATKYENQQLGEIGTVKQVRSIFHRAGLDPTRYRPSSESLLRRAVKGKGLYFVNSVVDLVNYFSLKTLWPIGLYDADKLRPPIVWRVGREGESYEGIGRDRLNLAHFPLLVDQEGPFGSPISDSMRTRVTEQCTKILWITFAPPDETIPLKTFAETMTSFNGGAVTVSTEL
jgi:DNA/RNA-binding domain of Phe-tRNA-synthetase-like protein